MGIKEISNKKCLFLTKMFLEQNLDLDLELDKLEKAEINYFMKFLTGFLERPLNEYYKNHPERKFF